MCVKPEKLENLHVPNVYLNDKQLDWFENIKYLGVIISSNKSDKDIYRETRSMYSKGNLLHRNFHKCASDVKEFIFKTYFSDVFIATSCGVDILCICTRRKNIQVFHGNINKFYLSHHLKTKCVAWYRLI